MDESRATAGLLKGRIYSAVGLMMNSGSVDPQECIHQWLCSSQRVGGRGIKAEMNQQ